MSSLKAINIPKPKPTISMNLTLFPIKYTSFLIPYPQFAKTLNSAHLLAPSSSYQVYSACESYDWNLEKGGRRQNRHLLALCTRKSHTDTHCDDNTIDENPNPIEIDPQQNQTKSTLENPSSTLPSASSKGLIFDIGQMGCWDSSEIGSPVVKRFLSDDEERWYMWYSGSSDKKPGLSLTGLAVSSNGVHWERGEQAADSSSGTGVVMNCSEDWWGFDTKSIQPSEIMVMASNKVRISSAVYWLYYTGLSSEEIEMEIPLDSSIQFKSLPGLAISQDGRNWARIEGDHHSGALFDVGSKGEWDSLFIASPHVVFHSNGDLRMYYHSFDPQEMKFSIGMARSRDGLKWVKLGKIKSIGRESSDNEMGVMNACVVRDKKNGNYLMAYEGIARDGKRSIGMSVSEDGLKDWRPVSNEAVLTASKEDGWDSKGVGSPCLVQMDGDEDQWRLYYTGVGMEDRTRIGLAISQGSDITSFRRWPGLNL
ncbi:unnamed protein product [Amaranthus hypochondriacus]